MEQFRFNLREAGESEFAETLMVSGDYFRVLGLDAQRGRLLTSDDDTHGCGPGGGVLSDSCWRRAYASRDDAIGRSLRLSGQAFEIVG